MKKMLPWIIVILLAVTLIIGAAFILWNQFMKESAPTDPRQAAINQAEQVEGRSYSAEELSTMIYSIDDVISNLANPRFFVSASFTFELDSPEAAEEFGLLSYKMKDVINTTLSDMAPDAVQGSAGLDAIGSELLNETNQLLQKGKVRHVYITKFIVTEQ